MALDNPKEHRVATATGQLNTILTFYEISDPPIPSPLFGIPAYGELYAL
ncbi:hypothetical protein AZE42_09455 [Rhizopogon vesiculosus]|uniref:Uncharacterized protein n=1 Tax=Rhizopogon vesiculosus TaxID=180088 RepID=A0A1J8QZ72_9AGAM|nr:hypothetical protein AZE42_09455 [Rhizopogon vesiculosus]